VQSKIELSLWRLAGALALRILLSERPERRRSLTSLSLPSRLRSPYRPAQRHCSLCNRLRHNQNTCPDK
ncbi:hypothetical protein BX616_007196, partial [Lobosporangium transversale]